MSVPESQRYELYKALVEHLGAEEAQTLMDYLSPSGWDDMSTRQDLEHLRALTKADLDQHQAATKAQIRELRAEMRSELQDVRSEMRSDLQELRTEMQSELHDVRTEMRSELQDVRTEMRSELQDVRSEIQTAELRLEAKIDRGLRVNALTVIGVNASLLTAAVTAAALLSR